MVFVHSLFQTLITCSKKVELVESLELYASFSLWTTNCC